MKVIITGGTGLIGRALTKNLLDDNHEVIILSRKPKKANMPDGVTVVEWDAKTGNGWSEYAEGADAIVNLAGETIGERWTPERKQAIMESRVNAGNAVVEAVKATTQKPKVLIQASAVGYYGPRGDEVITEESESGSDFLAKVCQAWEDSTKDVEEMGVRRVVIRTGIVLSTKGGALEKLMLPFKMFAGGPNGDGEQYWAWIHLMDEVQAIRFLIENDTASGIFNLSAPDPTKNKDFVKALGKALNRPAITPAPGFAMKMMLGEMATIVLDGQRAVPQNLQDMNYEFNFVKPEPALRHLLYSGYE